MKKFIPILLLLIFAACENSLDYTEDIDKIPKNTGEQVDDTLGSRPATDFIPDSVYWEISETHKLPDKREQVRTRWPHNIMHQRIILDTATQYTKLLLDLHFTGKNANHNGPPRRDRFLGFIVNFAGMLDERVISINKGEDARKWVKAIVADHFERRKEEFDGTRIPINLFIISDERQEGYLEGSILIDLSKVSKYQTVKLQADFKIFYKKH